MQDLKSIRVDATNELSLNIKDDLNPADQLT